MSVVYASREDVAVLEQLARELRRPHEVERELAAAVSLRDGALPRDPTRHVARGSDPTLPVARRVV